MNSQTRSRTAKRSGPVSRFAMGLGAVAVVAACSTPAEDEADRSPTTDDTEPAEVTDTAGTGGATDTSSTDTSNTDATTETAAAPDSAPSTDAVADESVADGPATGDPVVVAVLYPDVSVAAEFGFAEEVSDFAPAFEALMNDANERGGIAGHEIDLEMVQFDLAVEGDAVSGCLTATQDLDALVVVGVGGVYGDPVVCVAEQNETLMVISDGAPDEFYERSDGRLFSLTPSKGETQAAIVDAFADELGSAPFAVFSALDTGGDNDAVEATLLPTLADAGLEPAVTVVLDSDTEVAASQIPVEVEELRAAGVETIISTAGFFTTAPFASALEAEGIDVTWVGSDAAGFASDLFAGRMPPAQLDGARAITVHSLGWQGAGLDEPATRSDCRARAGELMGIDIAVDSIEVAGAAEACNYADLLVDAGRLVDGALTSESLAAALQSVTTIDLVDYGPSGFGDGDVTAAQGAREVTWSADCGCWSAVGEFEPVFGG